MALRLFQVAVALAITAFWAATMREGLQLERAATPQDIRSGRAPYEALRRALDEDPDQYVTIYQGNHRVGWSRTQLHRLAGERFLVRNEIDFSPDALVSIPSRMESDIQVGTDSQIERLHADLQMAGDFLRLAVDGEVSGNELVLTTRMPGSEPRVTRVARELTLFSGLSPFVGAPQLAVGESWNIQGLDYSMMAGGFDAGALRARSLTALVRRKETLVWNDRPVETLVVEIEPAPNDPLRKRSQAWIAADDGRVLREEHRVLNWTFTFVREAKPPAGPPPRGAGWRVFR